MQEMLEQAKIARALAYAPYSRFQVGCCLQSGSGKLYRGTNIENASYGLTLCAEGSAIAAMLNAGETIIKAVTVISSGQKICTPCGACRQRLREFAALDTPVHMYNSAEEKMSLTLAALLPHSFGPEFLGASHIETSA